MHLRHVIAGVLLGCTIMKSASGRLELFNFTKPIDLSNWSEISDTVREVGKSKATLALQQTRVFQRAIFFTLLNPQPNGAGFAGVRTPVHWDLTNYSGLRIRCRGQGENKHYKVVLRHKNQESYEDVEYEQLFDAPMSNSTFGEVELPLSNFKPYYRGQEKPNAEPLDIGQITMFGLQMYGGVYLSYKQSGVSALEIDSIEAY